jgi:hypothetical protein
LNKLARLFESTTKYLLCSATRGYGDANFEMLFPTRVPLLGVGPTFGVQVSSTTGRAHPYVGLSIGTVGKDPSINVTFSSSSGPPSPGFNVAVGAVSYAVAGQFGFGAIGRNGSFYTEAGYGGSFTTTSPGANTSGSIQMTWVFAGSEESICR